MEKLRDVALVDLSTGEVVEEVSRARLPAFVFMFQSALWWAARDRTLRGESLRVLLGVVSRMGNKNRCTVACQRELGESLGISQSSVARSLKQLRDSGIVVRGVRVGGGHVYTLHPDFAWKGNAHHRADALRGIPPLRTGSALAES